MAFTFLEFHFWQQYGPDIRQSLVESNISLCKHETHILGFYSILFQDLASVQMDVKKPVTFTEGEKVWARNY